MISSHMGRLTLLGLALGAAAHISTALGAAATVPNTEIRLALHADGSPGFTGTDSALTITNCETPSHPVAHTPGADGDNATCMADKNGIVRSFDTVTYRVDWNVNEVDATGVQFTIALPAAPAELEWTSIPNGCDMTLSSISASEVLTCVMGDFHEGHAGTIFPQVRVGGTRADIDGEFWTVSATLDTNETAPVTAVDTVTTTISAAPNYDWLKGMPKYYYWVEDSTTGDEGAVVTFPIYFIPGGVGDKGSAPMDDTQPVRFYDHLYWLSTQGQTFDAQLITPANVGNFTGAPFGVNGNRSCGGYSDDGAEYFWNATTSALEGVDIPYGQNISGLSTAANTTAGALAGTESITCTDVTGTNGYPIVQIDITGHNTTSAPPDSAAGTANPEIRIAGEISFWIKRTEMFPASELISYVHNTISENTDPIALPTGDFVTSTPDPVDVAGSASGEEWTEQNNSTPGVLKNESTSGGGGPGGPSWGYSHWVVFQPGVYKEVSLLDTDTGLYANSMNNITGAQGGLGSNNFTQICPAGWGGYCEAGLIQYQMWDFLGQVSRNQDMVIEYGIRTAQRTGVHDWFTAKEEAIHGCVHVDNNNYNIVDFPATFDVDGLTTQAESVRAEYSYGTSSPSNGLFHLIFGDHSAYEQKSESTHPLLRKNPTYNPGYVVEVAQRATGNGITYDRAAVSCSDADAVGGAAGWTTVDVGTGLAQFESVAGSGRYDLIDMVRVRMLDPVKWNAPSTMMITNNDYPHWSPATQGNPTYTGNPMLGGGFNLYIQTKVKESRVNHPDGNKLHVHASRARGDAFSGDPAALQDTCLSSVGLTADDPDWSPTATGWCNRATDVASASSGVAGDPDPYEKFDVNYVYLSHRDTLTIVGPKLNLKKTNVLGPSQVVQTDDLMTFNVDVSVTGAPVIDDQLTNITVTDTLPAQMEFVSMTQPVNGGTCSVSGQTVTCSFGDQMDPWTDSFTITAKARHLYGSSVYKNTAIATGTFAADGSSVTTRSSVNVYTPALPLLLDVRKDVPDLLGPCIHDPGLTFWGAQSGDCSVQLLNGQLMYDLVLENKSGQDLDVKVIDILPHLADENEAQDTFEGTPTSGDPATLGDGRQIESDFSGTATLNVVGHWWYGATIPAWYAGNVVIYYTNAPAGSIVRSPDHPSNLSGGSTQWCTDADITAAVAGCPASLAASTAFMIHADKIPPGIRDFRVTLDTNGNIEDDIYTNTYGAKAAEIGLPARSNDVSIMVEPPIYDLAIVKTLAAGQSAVVSANGDTVDYEITVANQGFVPSGEYSVTDMIPTGMSLVSATPMPDVAVAGATGLITWTFPATGELAPNSTQTILLQLQIDDITQGGFRNWVEIETDSGDDEDSTPGTNDANDSGAGFGGNGADDVDNHNDITLDEPANDEDDSDYEDVGAQSYDLALIKAITQVSPTPASLGTQVAYTITVMNQGSEPSGTFTVTDTIPAGMSFVSASAGGALVGGVVTWVVPATSELQSGDFMTFSVVMQIDDVSLQPFKNVADIVADSGDDDDSTPGDGSGAADTFNDSDVTNDQDPGDQDDSDFEILGAVVEYDLALIKARTNVAPTPVAVGSQVTYEITVMNQGNVNSGTYTVDDLIPAGMGYVSSTPAADSDPGAGGTGAVQWVVPATSELAPGATATFEVVLQILDAADAPYKNIAEITADSGDDDDSDPTDGSGGVDSFDDNDVTNDEDPNDEDDSDFDELTLEPVYDLALIKERMSVSPTPTAIGSQVTYNITVMNQGDLPSGTYTVTDLLPAGLTYVSSNPAATTDPGVGSSGAITWVVPAVNELAPGGQATFELVAEVAAGAVSPLKNISDITADSGDDDDSDPTDGSGATDSFDDGDVTNDEDPGDEDDSDFDLLVLDGVYDLALIKRLLTVSPSPAAVGSLVTYEVTVRNQGGLPSGTYTVNDVIPLGMNFVSAVPAETTGPGAGANGTVTWVVPATSELLPGDEATFMITVEIDDAAPAPYHNTSEITEDSGDDDDSDPTDGSGATDTFDDDDVTNDQDPGDQDDSDFADLDLGDSYDLALIKEMTTVTPSPADHGSQVEYTITVMNQGTVNSGAYQVTDLIPAGMEFVSASSSVAGAVITDPGVGSTGPVMFDVLAADELLPNGQATFTVIVEITSVADAPYHNIAEITEDSGSDEDSDPTDGSGTTDDIDDMDVTTDVDPDDEDDSDFADLDVTAEYDLALIKSVVTVNPSPAELGTHVTYMITVMNQGNVPSGDYQVTDLIPAGMSFVSASATPAGTTITDPGVGSGGSVMFDVPGISGLGAGDQTIFNLTLQIDDVTLSPYKNIADITEDSGDDDDSDPTDGSGSADTFDDEDVTNDQDPSDQDDSDFAEIGVEAEYDLALIKAETSVAPTPAAVGSQVTYTITVMNQGNVPSGTYTVDDLIPAGMGFVSAAPAATTDPGVGSAGVVQWVVAATNELPAGGQATFTLVTEILDASLAPYKNISEITEDSGDDNDSDPGDGSGGTDTFDDNDVTNDEDPNDEDDSDFSELSLEPKYDLALIKERLSVTPTPTAIGSQVAYRITVMNQGDLPSGTYTVADLLPAGLTYVSSNPVATADPGVGASGTVTWVVPATSELAPGGQATFELVAEVAAGAVSPLKNISDIIADSGDDDDSDPTDGSGAMDSFDDGDVTNDEDPGDEDDSDFDLLVLDGVYDLALIKDVIQVSPTPAVVGSAVTYQITVMNQGGLPSGAYAVSDAIPVGMTFVSASPAASSDPGAGNGGTVTWSVNALNELLPGDTTTFTLILNIDDAAGSPYHNTSEIISDSGDDDDSDPTDGSGGTDTFDDQDVTNDEDPGDEDDSDFADIELGDSYDLALIKEIKAVLPTPADFGSQVEYTITVMNQGTVDSGAYQVTDLIPAGMTFVAATATPAGTVITDPGVGNGGSVMFDVPLTAELGVGLQTTFTVMLEITDVANAPFRNSAEITEDSGADEDSDPTDGSGGTDTIDDMDVTTDEDPGDEDDSDFAELPVAAVYDLSLIKTMVSASPTPADLGSVVTYTVTVMNQGNVPSGAYQVTDIIPAGMSFDSATATPAGTVITAPAVGGTGTVVFDVPAISGLGAGSQTTFDVLLKIDDAGQSPFTNIADITEDSGDDVDSDPTDGSGSTDTLDDTDVTLDVGPTDQDDSDFDELTVEVRYDLALIKRMKAGTPIDLATGGQNTFEILVKNQGNVDSGAFSVTDMIPTGMSYVSSIPAADAPAATGTTGLITWSIPATSELAPMAMMTIELVLQVDDPSQATFRNWAEIETDSSGDYGVTDDDSTPGTNDGNDNGPGDNGDGSDPVINHNDIDHDDPAYSNAADDEDDSDYEDLQVRYDLALVKILAPGQTPWILVGSQVDYHVTVKNQGNVPSQGFTVIDTLPVGMSWVGATGPGMACVHDGSATGGSATCTYTPPTAADLAPGASVILELTLQVDDLVNATFTNWAEIATDSASAYGVTDDDSTPGDHGASDAGPGDTSTGGDPSIDHNNIDHDDGAYDDATEDEDDSDPATIYAAASTPVTLQTFLATLTGEQVSIYFSTSTEEANVGFHVYGRKSAAGRWFRLNDAMIVASDNGNNGASYNLAADSNGAVEFALSDIDAFGKETPHGPFKAGQIYGRNPNDPGETVVEDADDLEIEDDVEEVAAAASNVAHLRVYQSGIQQVTVKALRAEGVNLVGTPVADLALTYNDESVPLWIGNAGVAKTDGVLSRNDVIEFIATADETMYRDFAVYRLFVDASTAERVLETSADTTGSAVSERGMRHVEWAPNNLYGRTSPIDDAWYAKRLTALLDVVEHTAVVKTPRVDNASTADAMIKVTVWGGSDDANVAEDHHVKVYVNGTEVADAKFDGLTASVIETSVAASTLLNRNSVKIEAINDGGAGVSAVAIESIEITYPADLSLKQGRVTFDASAEAFMVEGQGDDAVTVWRSNDQGMTRSVSADGLFRGASDESTYHVATAAGMQTPEVRAARAMGDLVTGPAEYLIITHGRFNNGDLQRLADTRRGEGMTVKTVDVSWIYEANASGNVSSGAIQDYIAWAHENLGTQAVLLVGGDTYDYKGYLGESKARSMIPTLYGPSAAGVNHAPADPMYGDVDGDGVPEVAIGRLPVQKQRELRDIVNKTLAYAEANFGNRAMFITDDVDDGSQRSFSREGQRMSDMMPEAWKSKVISLDELDAETARGQIVRRVQRGSALTTYIGHSDQSVWSFNRVLRRSDVRRLTNIGKPTVVSQFGCWNTYYVDPKRKSLAHEWLLKGENGAAAVMGASTITDATAEQLLADAMYEYLTRDGLTFGEAMVKAKQDLAAQYPMENVEDVLSGYLLLGDPMMRLPVTEAVNGN